MNSYERFFNTLNGLPTDCIPATPYNGNFCIEAVGMNPVDCYTDGKKLAEAMKRAWDITHQDVVVAQSDQYYITEAFGLKTHYRPNSLPDVVAPLLEEISDVRTMKKTINPYTDGRMYVYIEAVGLLSEYFKGEVPIRAPGPGAFTLISHLMGLENFIASLAEADNFDDEDDIGYFHELLEIMYEAHYAYAEACVKAGASIVQAADSLSSLDMISPKLFRKYASPYQKKFFSRINALKKDYKFATLLHVCGNNTLIMDDLADSGCDILECDYKVDLSQYKAKIGDRVCLMGNMNPAGNLFTGTPESVRQEAAIAIERGSRNGKFFLGSGCEVAVRAKVENVVAMVDYAHSQAPIFD